MSNALKNDSLRPELTRKGARRVREIVGAGAEILFEEGFRAVNKRRIANRLNMSDGNVSYYFPTTEALWTAVIEHEILEYYKRHHKQSQVSPDNPQEQFDEYVIRWIDEYQDRMVRIFFSQVITTAEVNELVARMRDEIYEAFVKQATDLARPLVAGVSETELERRVLVAIALLEGLHAVSAFRPTIIEQDPEFKNRIIAHVNAIVYGQLS